MVILIQMLQVGLGIKEHEYFCKTNDCPGAVSRLAISLLNTKTENIKLSSRQ